MATGSLFMSGVAQAQPLQTTNLQELSLEQAVRKAMDNYPAIKAAQLEIESQQALRKTAWEIRCLPARKKWATARMELQLNLEFLRSLTFWEFPHE